jgi:hypothetical protein
LLLLAVSGAWQPTAAKAAIVQVSTRTAGQATTGPGYITILFGRSMFSLADSHCNEISGSVTLDQIAQDLHARGLSATGAVVINRTQTASLFCLYGNMYTAWSDLAALRDTYGSSFVSDGLTHNNITQMTASQQYEESCNSLAYLTENGHTRADGFYAYGANNFTTSIQTNVVSKCFDYARRYGQGANVRSNMTSPWFQTTNSILGGACNDPAQSCYNISANGRRYTSPLAISSLLQVSGDQWTVAQFYKMVTGASLTTSPAWDCTNSNWQEHWTNEPESYCINDFDQAISTIPASAVVTDPATVAAAWGRAMSNVAGVVSTAGTGQPIAGANVSWSGASTTTDTSGYYTLASVTPGTTSVSVSASGYAKATASVNVTSGSTVLQNFAVGQVTTGAIGGTVTDSVTNAAIVGAAVSYTGPGGSSGTTNTAGDGTYTFNPLPEGSYMVTASATSYSSETFSVGVAPGATTIQNFALVTASHRPIFSDGFESGNFSAWTTNGGLTIETSTVHSGVYAAEVKTTNGGGFARRNLPSIYSTGYGRTWFDIVSQSSQVNVGRLNNSTGTSICFLFVTASGILGMNANGTKTLSTTTVSKGTFHELELALTVNGSSSTTQVWLDGTKVNALSRTMNLGTSPMAQLQIGQSQAGGTYQVIFDDAAFDTQFLP